MKMVMILLYYLLGDVEHFIVLLNMSQSSAKCPCLRAALTSMMPPTIGLLATIEIIVKSLTGSYGSERYSPGDVA